MIHKLIASALAALILGAAAATDADAAEPATGYHLIPGSYVANRGPDGNSIFIDAPEGLILVDTGRHPEHRDKLLSYARKRGRPIVAIINTHWHYDHTTGNGEILAAYPRSEVIASRAVDEPMYADFIAQSRRNTQGFLASGKATDSQKAEIARALKVMDDPSALRAKSPVDKSETRTIGGRALQLNLAKYAASEGDVWIFDAATKLAIAGDLVVAPMPFMDTACPEAWQQALSQLAAAPWETLIPGHGDPMNRAQFTVWQNAFNAFVACGLSIRSERECAGEWVRNAAAFIPAGDAGRMTEAAEYYSQLRFRLPEERGRFCPKEK